MIFFTRFFIFGYIGVALAQKLTKGLQKTAYKPLILLARPAGFEPATYGFVVRHSIQLSYGRFVFVDIREYVVFVNMKFSPDYFAIPKPTFYEIVKLDAG